MPNTLALTRTLAGGVSPFSVGLLLFIFHMLVHAEELNKSFKSLFAPTHRLLLLSNRPGLLLLLWLEDVCITQGRGTGFVLLPQLQNLWQVRLIAFFYSGSRKTGNTTKHCYLTTAFHQNKSKMFKEIQRNHGPFSALAKSQRKSRSTVNSCPS